MKIFKNIREFFWPLLEKDEIPDPIQIESNEINVDSENLEKTLEYAIEFHESEYERKKTVEDKSSLFISIISVVTSIILGVTSVLVKVNDFSLIMLVLLVLLFILTIYMTRTVWFSLKTLERKAYNSISINDFLINEKDAEYYKILIASITNKVRKNSMKINEKVNNMAMAQEYFKRAIVVVSIYSFVILLFFISKADYGFNIDFLKTADFINRLNLNGWNIIAIYFLILVSIIIGLRATIKK